MNVDIVAGEAGSQVTTLRSSSGLESPGEDVVCPRHHLGLNINDLLQVDPGLTLG